MQTAANASRLATAVVLAALALAACAPSPGPSPATSAMPHGSARLYADVGELIRDKGLAAYDCPEVEPGQPNCRVPQ